MDVSIITPVYNEAEGLPELVRRVVGVMEKTELKWELIPVDDGSTDGSGDLLLKLAKDFKNLNVVRLRRNYGQTAAMQAGFDAASGRVWITMDSDLQNDPKDIPKLLETMEKEQADVVSGWRKDRKDKDPVRKLLSRIANGWFVPKMTGVRLKDTGCSLKAYRAEVMGHVRIYGELHRFIPAVAAQFGAKVVEVPVTHHDRAYGSSKYGLDRTFRVMVDLVLLKFFQKYLHRPMHFFGQAGLMCFVPGGLILSYLMVLKTFGQDIGGRPLLILGAILILIGGQLLGMGILAELMTRIYHEPQGRKQYTLKK